MKKAYFQYYETFETVVNKINDVTERENFRKIIIDYGLHGEEPAELSPLQEMAFVIIKELIDQQLHRREVNAANRAGKKAEPSVIIRINNGAEEIERPLQGPEPDEPEADTLPAEITEGEIENIKLEAANGMKPAEIARTHGRTVAEIKKHLPKSERFIKPTVEEIAAHIKAKGYGVNAQVFFNYYEANGWKVGKNSMKSWQAALQNWNARDKASGKTAGTVWTGTDTQTAEYEELF